ncbi:MAG: Rieske 2Fe-2S domain-containing protein, partial [Myxococcales bacterium]|nr:Rieske 2Fe-2S domain-containing protein [Myxococcales bacterium]
MDARFPFSPFPNGWYAVAFSEELQGDTVLTRSLAGRPLVLFRDAQGQAAALAAHCPHLGAHLGHGGRVVAGNLRCPMHGFQFDASGHCIETGYGTRPPPSCRARSYAVHEILGAVFLWHHLADAQPQWRLPDHGGGERKAWHRHVYRSLSTHPQETTENSVDLGHFQHVHGYRDIKVVEPLRLEGPHLTAAYSMRRRPLVAGTPDVRAKFHIEAHGLGCSVVDVEIESHGLLSRHLVLATPTDEGKVDLHLAMSLQGSGRFAGKTASAILRMLIGRVAFRGYLSDVRQDFEIWANKRYQQPPALAEGDGPI